MRGTVTGAVLVLSIPLLAAGQKDTTPLSRGEYVFLLADCNGCHSVHDYARLGGPIMPGYSGVGQIMKFDFGFPAKIVSANITPDKETGIGTWTDAEIRRAVRDGVGRDGRTLFPMMPYAFYRSMSDDDAKALLAYLRTLKPLKNLLPRTELPPGFRLPPPPKPVAGVVRPSAANRVKYGEYLATIGTCADCHTPEAADHKPDASKRFAGGREFRLTNGLEVVSANITPDPETGIGKWTEQQFINRFAAYKQYTLDPPPPVGPDQFTVMPWLSLSHMTAEDLGAIYTYLRSVPAVKDKVQTHPIAAKQARK